MIYVFLADGFEEVEAFTPVDLLRRAGLSVKTVGIDTNVIRGSHDIPVVTDLISYEIKPSDMDKIDMIVLPGGMPGTLNLEDNETVQSVINFCLKNDRFIAAICAAPSILGHLKILDGKRATCFPGFEKDLGGALFTGGLVEKDGKIITARGAGAAMKFALELVKVFKGQEFADELEVNLQCR